MLQDRIARSARALQGEDAGFHSIGALPAQPLDGFNDGFGQSLALVDRLRAVEQQDSFFARRCRISGTKELKALRRLVTE
jgi:hypothetical protein